MVVVAVVVHLQPQIPVFKVDAVVVGVEILSSLRIQLLLQAQQVQVLLHRMGAMVELVQIAQTITPEQAVVVELVAVGM
jgi:hypothetical protein